MVKRFLAKNKVDRIVFIAERLCVFRRVGVNPPIGMRDGQGI